MTETNALVTQAETGGLAAFLEQNNAFTDLAGEYNVIGDIINFSGNDGVFRHKQQEVPHGTSLIFNCFEMQKGWICWKGKKPIDKIIGKVRERYRVLPESELPDHGPYEKEGEGWSEFISMPVVGMDGEIPQVDLGLSSKSGVSALARLGAEYGAKARMNLDDKGRPKMPIVEIGAVSFESKVAIGKKWAPTFKIVDWISIDEMDEVLKSADEAANGDGDAAPQEATPAEPVKEASATPAKGFQTGRVGKRI